jgi:hypothetical protein
MEKFGREDGPADSIGRLIVRLARVLKLDGIAVLETSTNGSFRDAMGFAGPLFQQNTDAASPGSMTLNPASIAPARSGSGKQRNFLDARAQPSHTSDSPT